MTTLRTFAHRSVLLLAAASPVGALAATITVQHSVGNANVPLAQIYLNGKYVAATNGEGKATVDVKAGDELVARKFLFAGTHYKPGHQWQSSGNWNYRVYITSASVGNSGAVTKYVVSGRPREVKLVVRPENTLIGLNWLFSCEWDTTAPERAELGQRMQDASTYLYNVTDGQFFIEHVRITDMGASWADADARAATDYTLRANVNSYGGGFLKMQKGILTYMNMGRINHPATYIHEFGHYGMSLPDEYKDDDATAVCTELLDTADPTYKKFAPKSSCMMHQQKESPKLCSGHASNPHNLKLSATDCWTRVLNLYKDTEAVARYRFQTPMTRETIVGKVTLPVAAWAPTVDYVNSDLPNLVPPRVLKTDGLSKETKQRMIYSREMPNGRFLRQGKVWFNGEKPEHNTLPIAGLHVGDIVFGDSYFAKIEGPPDKVGPNNLLATLDPWAFFQREDTREITLQRDPKWLPLQVGAGLTQEPGVVEITVKSPTAFSGTPTVEFQPAGAPGRQTTLKRAAVRQTDPSTLTARLTFAANEPMEGLLIVTGAASDGRKATVIREFAATEPDPSGPSQVADPTGSLIVRMATPAVTTGERVGVGPSEAPEPAMAGWFTVVDPKRVTRQSSNRFNAPVSLVFQVPTPDDSSRQSLTETMSLEYRIVRWDAAGGWTPVETVQHPDLDIATGATSTTGHFALMARKRTALQSLLEGRIPTGLRSLPAR